LAVTDLSSLPSVEQRRFTRSEWLRGLTGVTEADAMPHCGQLHSLAEVLRAWRNVTAATDAFLAAITTEDLVQDLPVNGRPAGQNLGSAIQLS
jgi:hypothetical protein